jgi:hypothetical protein
MMPLKTRATEAAARQSGSWRGLWLQAGLVLLGACAVLGPGDRESSRVYPDVAPDALYDRTLQALQASGLEVTEADRTGGVITAAAQFDQRNWANCPASLMLVDDQGGESQMVDASEDHREVELRASVTDGSQGARLTLDPAFVTEPVSPMASTEGCGTTGVLENRILEAVAAQA